MFVDKIQKKENLPYGLLTRCKWATMVAKIRPVRVTRGGWCSVWPTRRFFKDCAIAWFRNQFVWSQKIIGSHLNVMKNRNYTKVKENVFRQGWVMWKKNFTSRGKQSPQPNKVTLCKHDILLSCFFFPIWKRNFRKRHLITRWGCSVHKKNLPLVLSLALGHNQKTFRTQFFPFNNTD